LGIGAWGSKNYNDGATEPKNMFDDIFSHLDTIRERGGQTPANSKYRANALSR